MSDGAGQAAVRWVLSGRVQGVAFRLFTRRSATELGVTGWVRNLPDGTVEVEASGPPQVLAELRRRLEQGPPGSRVTGVHEESLADSRHRTSFEISY